MVDPAETEENYSTGIIVLGPHRSGTSLLSGILGKMGCDLPCTLMSHTEDNPKGYFESSKVMLLNDLILKSLGTDWKGVENLYQSNMDDLEKSDFLGLAVDLIEKEFLGARQPILKDPRICLLTNFWTRAFREAGYRVAYVHTYRNPLEVAESLLKRDGIPLEMGLHIWMKHVLESEHATRGSPRAFTNYDSLLQDWRGQVSHIEGNTGIFMPCLSRGDASQIDDFVSDSLHRNRFGLLDLMTSPYATKHVIDMYWILERYSKSAFDGADSLHIDNIREELNDTDALGGVKHQ